MRLQPFFIIIVVSTEVTSGDRVFFIQVQYTLTLNCCYCHYLGCCRLPAARHPETRSQPQPFALPTSSVCAKSWNRSPLPVESYPLKFPPAPFLSLRELHSTHSSTENWLSTSTPFQARLHLDEQNSVREQIPERSLSRNSVGGSVPCRSAQRDASQRVVVFWITPANSQDRQSILPVDCCHSRIIRAD